MEPTPNPKASLDVDSTPSSTPSLTELTGGVCDSNPQVWRWGRATTYSRCSEA